MTMDNEDTVETLHSGFSRAASTVSRWTGRPTAFLAAAGAVVIWAVTGPFFDYSNNWQLVINTGTTIVTFLMVFLIQNTQNRDMYAVQLKLDEIIRATRGAHTELLDIEELSEAELCRIRDQYEKLAADARRRIKAGKSDTHTPDVNIHG